MRAIAGLLFLASLVILPACGEDFTSVQDADTIEGYETFAAANPGSIYQPQIDTRLDDLYYTKAQNDPTLDNYDTYLKKFPKGKHLKDANGEREDILFNKTVATNTPDAYSDFLKQYPRAQAQHKLKAEYAVNVAAYQDKLGIGEPKVHQVNMAEDKKGPMDGWGIDVDVTNSGDKTMEYLAFTLSYLGSDGKVLGTQEYPVVSPVWKYPVEDIAKVPMKPGDKRTWEWTTASPPDGWVPADKSTPKVSFAPTGLRFVMSDRPAGDPMAVPAAPAPAPEPPK